jgi:NTP pyrophosphatase (non-canonical NTP hydrolase)
LTEFFITDKLKITGGSVLNRRNKEAPGVERPVSLDGWQEMFAGIYTEKDERDYAPADLLLRVQEEAAKIDEGIRKENGPEINNALPHLFCWFLSFCNMVGIDIEEAVWEKYPAVCPYCGREENCMCITEEEKPSQWFKNYGGRIPTSLDDWQEMFRRIYGRINKATWLVQVWLHVHEELGELSREFRLEEISKTREEVADCFAWLMAFCNKLNIQLGAITWRVYPGVCSVCKKDKCQCPKV